MSASASALLRDQFEHMEWADATIWTAVLACASAVEDAVMRRYLAHQHLVQRAFLDAWTDQPLVLRDESHFADVPAIYDFARAYYPPARAFLRSIDDEQLAAAKILPWADWASRHLGRAVAATTLGDTIAQVIAHASYHRGQINARLRAAGGVPPLVDVIAWVWLGRPQPAWPS